MIGRSRTPPPGSPVDAGGSAHEPGIVEVQFREGVVPTIPPAQGNVALATSARSTSLDRFNEIAQRHQLVAAEPSLRASVAEATAAQTTARAAGFDVPHYANLVSAEIRTAIAANLVVCVAAGNGSRDAGIDDGGTAFDETGSILGGATSYDATQNRRASFSTYGSRIVVSAPGDPSHDLTLSCNSDTAYRNGFGGTSGATPKVAGVAALLLEANPALTHTEIRAILRSTGSAVVTAASGGWSGWHSLGGWIDRLAVGHNADGRLEIFARGSDGALWHNWQTAPSGGWSGWSSLGGWIDLLEVGSNHDGRLEVFVRGSDKAVWHNCQVPNDRISVARNSDGRLELFARGSDAAVWHNWQTAPSGGWSGWSSLGGWIDRLDVSQNQDGRLEVFARGSDKSLWHNWQVASGGWSGWNSLGGWIDLVDVGQNTP